MPARVHEVLVSSEDLVTSTAKIRLAQAHEGCVRSTAGARVRGARGAGHRELFDAERPGDRNERPKHEHSDDERHPVTPERGAVGSQESDHSSRPGFLGQAAGRLGGFSIRNRFMCPQRLQAKILKARPPRGVRPIFTV